MRGWVGVWHGMNYGRGEEGLGCCVVLVRKGGEGGGK